jgi:hypothetical protein
VDGAGDQLLASTGFSDDQNGGVGRRHHRDARERGFERRRGTDDLTEHQRAFDVLA